MTHSKKLHMTIPVLNEEPMLAQSVHKVLSFCEANGIDNFELCIADNGSTDRTQQIGEELASAQDRVNYIRLPKRGFGLALKAAWSQCRADYVGYMDLDLSTDLTHLREVYDLIQQETDYALIVGSRLKEGSKVENRTLLREITSRGFNFLLRANLAVGFTDGMCGFKIVEKSFYDGLAARFEFTDEWFFATELAVRTEWVGGKVLDIPVHWVDDANSKSSAQLFRLIRQYLAGIRKLKREKQTFAARGALL